MRNEPGNGISAVFLDRDGTLIEEVSYLNHPRQIQPLPGAARAVREFNRAGLKPVVITNQSAVARGLISLEGLEEVHREMGRLFRELEADLEHFYYCPHHSDFAAESDASPCRCRKPQPGLLLRAAEELGIDLKSSFMVGDRLRDVEAGRRAGCRTVLVRTGYGAAEERLLKGPARGVPPAEALPDFIADDLQAAIAWILERSRG